MVSRVFASGLRSRRSPGGREKKDTPRGTTNPGGIWKGSIEHGTARPKEAGQEVMAQIPRPPS
jgi:hypothetical protein